MKDLAEGWSSVASGGWRAGTAPGCTWERMSPRQRCGYGDASCVGFGGTALGEEEVLPMRPREQPLIMGRSMARLLFLLFCRKNMPAARATRRRPAQERFRGRTPSLNTDLRQGKRQLRCAVHGARSCRNPPRPTPLPARASPCSILNPGRDAGPFRPLQRDGEDTWSGLIHAH